MIVYESTFPAVESNAGKPLGRARIAYQSHARDLDLDASDISVSSELSTGPRDAPLRPETFEYWQASALPATWTLDFGTTVSLDYIALVGHTCGSEGVTVTAAIETGSPLSFLEFSDPVTPTDDSPILFLDTLRAATRMRLTFSGGIGSPANAPRVAVITAGQILKMERSVQSGHSPMPMTRETVMNHTLSRTGTFLGQSFRRSGLRGAASFVGLSADWYRTYFEPFVQEAREFPFLFAWNPMEYPREVAYCWLSDDVTPQQQLAGLVNVSIKMTGMGND